MITLCCPFVSELKNLLSDSLLGVAGGNKGASTFRKITPHSATERTNTHLQLQVRMLYFIYFTVQRQNKGKTG